MSIAFLIMLMLAHLVEDHDQIRGMVCCDASSRPSALCPLPSAL